MLGQRTPSRNYDHQNAGTSSYSFVLDAFPLDEVRQEFRRPCPPKKRDTAGPTHTLRRSITHNPNAPE